MSLYDRSYMSAPQNSGSGVSGAQMILILIAVNAVMFLLASPGSRLYFELGLLVDDGFSAGNIFQLVTAGFLHAGFSHILFNMWGLYLFGRLIAPYLTGWKMLALYLAGAVTGNLIFLLCNLHGAGSFLVGASGAVCAVMAAAATLEPERRFVMLFLPFSPIKTTTLVVCYTILELFFELTGVDRGIAHLAHLGGFFGGYLVMRIFFGSRLPWDPLRKLFGGTAPRRDDFTRFRRAPEPPPPPHGTDSGSRVSQKELDELLDKLSRTGINSLSEYEMERLRKARRQMRGEE